MNLHSTKLDRRQDRQTIISWRHDIPGAVIAWTDGSCDPNPGPGGWGYRIEDANGETYDECGGLTGTTNNRMELTAIIEAVRACELQSTVVVRTDSQLCVLCAVGRLKRKANTDLWTELEVQCRDRTVLFEWWRGHCGTPGNEAADELAHRGRLSVEMVARHLPDRISASPLMLASSS